MDTGASSHITSNQGTLSTHSNNSFARHITVGSGDSLPIKDFSMTTLPPPYPPFKLKNILHVPKIIKILCWSVNLHVIVLSPLNLIRLDLVKGTKLSDVIVMVHFILFFCLYQRLHSLTSPSLWHNRLGHPGDQVLHSLVSSHLISSVSKITSGVCHSCQLGKHNALSFGLSFSQSTMPFEIIHSC
ncbi:hypothetical protein OSB04_003564 [Centaurea solstitialis]|uniref:GAG-pre-integrase domain-containing protein n=1 Tax=Centaurea solstitialis TaxID=347529 RepID=A0AA38TV45_9ASTR|nr:hypothetical protein OSB04_003564 [Centaurea solstitialis]